MIPNDDNTRNEDEGTDGATVAEPDGDTEGAVNTEAQSVQFKHIHDLSRPPIEIPSTDEARLRIMRNNAKYMEIPHGSAGPAVAVARGGEPVTDPNATEVEALRRQNEELRTALIERDARISELEGELATARNASVTERESGELNATSPQTGTDATDETPEGGETNEDNDQVDDFTEISGVSAQANASLHERGINTFEDLRGMTKEQLMEVQFVGEATADAIINHFQGQ